jgi:hypothetical protein
MRCFFRCIWCKTGKELLLGSLFSTFLLLGNSCKKLVDVNPPTSSINSGNVYQNDATAIAAVTNIYVDISKENLTGGGIASMSLFAGLSADEISLYPGAHNNAVQYYYQNSLTGNNLNNPDFWTAFYKEIAIANTAIEALTASSGLTASVKQQLLGEAKFVRAFCYFYLLNLYGDVPLALTTDYKVNSMLPRASKENVYSQIVADLKEAQSLLSANFPDASLLNTTIDRVRPTKWSASALLARTYLYRGQWADAEGEASSIITNTTLFDTVSLANAFLKNNKEAIWQLQPVNSGWNTEDARIFLLPVSGPDQVGHPFYMSKQLFNSFEIGDKRKTYWIDTVSRGGLHYFYPVKYKSANYNDPITEYQTVFRLSEQYLIRGEARAQQSKISEALSDLNLIRHKAGLNDVTITDITTLLNTIQHERQVEFFTEWGHRWLDLKRTGKIDEVMNGTASAKGGTWNSNWQWYPISNQELLLNPNLEQNAGY